MTSYMRFQTHLALSPYLSVGLPSIKFFDNLLFYDCFYKSRKCIDLLGIELFQLVNKCIHSIGGFLAEIKKFLWSNVEIFADVKEICHRRKGSTTFDCTNIAGILPDLEAHVSCRHTLLCAQLSKPLRKLFFVHGHHHPSQLYCSREHS